jgi:Proteasome subunit
MSGSAILKTRPRPYILPRQKRDGKDKMYAGTIAAGFRCSDGVVLCADTEITLEMGKTYQSKIFLINEALGCYLTYSGFPDFAKELADELASKTAGKHADEAVVEIKSSYRDFFQRYCKPDESMTWTSILLTLREANRVNLYIGRQQQFPSEPHYATLGIGQAQAEVVFNPLYHEWMLTDEAVYTAIYGLGIVKRFVSGCGGETEYVEVLDDAHALPFRRLLRPSSREIEQDFEAFSHYVHTTLLAFPNLEVDSRRFKELLQSLQKTLYTHRVKRLQEHEAQQRQWAKGLED